MGGKDPSLLEVLQGHCAAGEIIWTRHALARMMQRDIRRDLVKSAVLSGEIVEYYPNDYPNPSCLLCSIASEQPLHVVCGVGEDALWIITVYRPDPREWMPDWKTRRRETL